MSTYYEVFGIPFTATVAEIEVAYETQYNRWRRLVTHHDPEMVNRANQALRWLEKAHVTLTDPTKREAYDAGIGLSGPVGGLTDPQARPQAARPTPPPPRQRAEPQVPPAAAERVDAWVCPKCQATSAVGTQFCKKCGHTLGRKCPKCNRLIEATAAFCSKCGVDIQGFIAEQERLAEERRRREQAEARRQAEEARRRAEERVRREAKEREQQRRKNRVIGCAMALLGIVVITGMIIFGIIFEIEQREYRIQATVTAERRRTQARATAEQRQANATATAEAFVSKGGMVDEHGVLMAYVPAGSFSMGSRAVALDAFWIDRTEVTNAQFAAFLNDQGNQRESGVTWLELEDEDCLNERSGGEYRPESGYADHPVVEVSWYGAAAYCRWRGARLPTEAEWEYAARGPEGHTYPWGNGAPTCKLAQFAGCPGETVSVGSLPAGASWCGAQDLAGNVWEWVADWYGSYPSEQQVNPTGLPSGTYRVLRGGSWYVIPSYVRSAYRGRNNPVTRDDIIGFRCARGSE